MYRFLPMAIMFAAAATPLAAQEPTSYFDLDGDRFLAGARPVHDTIGVDDLFMAGETVRSKKPITGTAHLAGRKVIITGAIGGDAYVAGMDVTLDAPVAGDATVSGYNISIAEVSGDLRVAGTNITISGPVSGYVLIAGDYVRFESVVRGDVMLNAQDVDFAEGTQIEGRLTIYEEDLGALEIPAQVVPDERIDRRQLSEWSEVRAALDATEEGNAVAEFLSGVVFIAVIGSVIAMVAPNKLADLRRSILDRPLRALWFGILAESVFVGTTIILIVTVIGLFFAPATLAVALAVPFAGYVVATYALGVGLLMAAGRSEPTGIGSRVMAASLGALAAGLIGALPYIGWVCVVGLSLAGVGSLALWLFRPKFYAAA